MPLAALYPSLLERGLSFGVLEALRWVVGGENMTTPGGASTGGPAQLPPSARPTGFYHGSEPPG
jgi:hypothetical protein